MSIATVKKDRASERFMLVKLTPGRAVTSELVAQGGGIYDATNQPFITVEKIERQGSSMNEVASLAAVTSNDDWFYDETTGQLRMKLAAAPSTASNNIIVFHNLFYTGSETRRVWEDPEDSNTTVRDWLARLERWPAISQSIRNITAGIFSVADVSFSLVNHDDAFNQWLSLKDSFNNKDTHCHNHNNPTIL